MTFQQIFLDCSSPSSAYFYWLQAFFGAVVLYVLFASRPSRMEPSFAKHWVRMVLAFLVFAEAAIQLVAAEPPVPSSSWLALFAALLGISLFEALAQQPAKKVQASTSNKAG